MTPGGVEGLPLLGAAFALGLVHALDADHVMAVSTFLAPGRSRSSRLGATLRWAAGHLAALLALGIGALLLGAAIPPALSGITEIGVGVVLVLLGLAVLRELLRSSLHLHFHDHDGLPSHAHWHTHSHPERAHRLAESHREEHQRGHDHRPLWVGLLHGAAGSAPVLAILPAAAEGALASAVLYLLVFGAGVTISMLCFGGAASLLFARAQQSSRVWPARCLHGLTGMASVFLGAFWIAQAL